MSSSKFELRVQSEDRLAVVEIADSKYQILGEGVCSIGVEVEPGLYVARVKSSDGVDERFVRVASKNEEIFFPTPGRGPAQSSYEAIRMDTSRELQDLRVRAGTRRSVSVAVSMHRRDSEKLDAGAIDGTRFWIYDCAGKPLQAFDGTSHDFESGGTGDSRLGSAAVRLFESPSLAPGWYALAMPASDGTRVLLPLYVCANFSPSVFVDWTSAGAQPRLDFDRLLVTYDSQEATSYGDLSQLSLIKIARRSLELGRNHLNDSLMQELLASKFRDPALGLIALQLLLVGSDKNGKRFNEVMQNLVGAFGMADHPDLVIARARARQVKSWDVPTLPGDAKDDALVAPPLFRANWNFMVGIDKYKRQMTQPGTLLNVVARHILRAGVWLLWKQSALAAIEAVEQAPAEVASAGAASSRTLRQADKRPPARKSAASAAMRKPGSSAATAKEPVLAADASDRSFSSSVVPSDTYAWRKARSVSARLEQVVDLVRTHGDSFTNVLNEQIANPDTGSVLDRTVARSILQLTMGRPFGREERQVPRGYALRMAKSLALPFALIDESVSRIHASMMDKGAFADTTFEAGLKRRGAKPGAAAA